MIKHLFNYFSKPLYRKILDLVIPDLILSDKIRLGKQNDGGYVIAKSNISKYKYLLSFGISNDVSFEKDFVKNNPNCRIFCFDPTVDSLPEQIENANFYKIGIDSKSNSEYKTLKDILSMVGICESDLKYTFLKMDIEGYEWRVFSHFESFSIINRIDQIALELHFKYITHGTKYELPLELFKRARYLKTLKENFYFYNLHANNCFGLEGFTRYHKFQFPHVVEISLFNKNSLTDIVIDINQVCNPEKPDIQKFYL